MRRDLILVAFLWAALTVVGEILIVNWDPFPLAAADEATIIDDAFHLLMLLGVPVFTFVLVTLVFCLICYRREESQPRTARPSSATNG